MNDFNAGIREIYKQYQVAQTKYTYFLLLAAGSGIGMAVNSTQESQIHWQLIPLALAVISWAMSFYFGCKKIQNENMAIYDNAELLKVQSGIHEKAGTHQKLQEVGEKALRSNLEEYSEVANNFAIWQFRLLISGAILFVIWHIVEMIVNTIE